MVVESKPAADGAASAAPMGGVAGMGEGFSATVAMPKAAAASSLVHINMTEEQTQMQGDTALSPGLGPGGAA